MPRSAGQITLAENDAGRTVTVAKGTRLTIHMRGNPSTGYRWEATVGDPSVMRETAAPIFTPSSGAPGAGGLFEFQYRARSAGETDLRLVYRRSWEAEIPPMRTFEISVLVR